MFHINLQNFSSSLSQDVKLLSARFGQGQTSEFVSGENRNLNLSNLLSEMNKKIERFTTDVSNAPPQPLHNSSLLIRFQNEISDLKRSFQNLENEKNHDKTILDELNGLVKRLESDIENVRTSSRTNQVSVLPKHILQLPNFSL